MAYLVEMNVWFLIAALLIGFATGAWTWARRRHRIEFAPAEADAPLGRTLERAPMPQPVAGAADAALSGGGTGAGDAAPPFFAEPQGEIDDLLRLKGVGPKLSTLLGELGVFHYHQIASWTDDHVVIVDERLGSFKGRIDRDRWREQARLLAEGRLDEFEAKFGSGSSGQG